MEHSTKQVMIREDPSAPTGAYKSERKKIREKNRSVASGLSVIDFEHGERAEGKSPPPVPLGG